MRRLFGCLLALAVAATGCLGDEPANREDAPAVETAAGGVPPTNDTTPVDDGTQEMGTDLGHQPHLHDYWKDRERVTLMDEDLDLTRPQNAIGFTFFNAFRGTPGVGGAYFELPDGAIVYEGTGRLEMTIAWTDATVTGMAMRYRSAAGPDLSEPMDVKTTVPLVVDVTPEMTDMPHAQSSRWAFLLSAGQPGQAMVGKVHVTIDIVKMRDIGLFPGHPELFGGAHTLTLYDGPATAKQGNLATQIASFATTRGPMEDGMIAERVVPMETRSMTANVTIDTATAGVGKVTDISLIYRAADTNRWTSAQLLAGDVDKGTFQFGWPVDMRQTDSPYAKQSMWRVTLHVSSDPTGGALDIECGGGCGTGADVTYTLQWVAYDSLLDGIQVNNDRN